MELLVIHFQLSRIVNDFVYILVGLKTFYLILFILIHLFVFSSHVFYHFI